MVFISQIDDDGNHIRDQTNEEDQDALIVVQCSTKNMEDIKQLISNVLKKKKSKEK